MRWLWIVLLVALVGCGGDGAGGEDALDGGIVGDAGGDGGVEVAYDSGDDGGGLDDVGDTAGGLDGGADTLGEVTTPVDPSLWCSSASPLVVSVVPAPRLVSGTGASLMVGSSMWSLSGAYDVAGPYVDAWASSLGMEYAEQDAGLSLVVASADAWGQVVAACDLDVPDVAGAYALSVVAGEGEGRAVVHVVAPDALGVQHALATVRQLMTPEGAITAGTVVDWPATEMRAVLEGFYGTPWTWEERKAMLVEMAHLKLGSYVYAPKDDPYITHLWTVPYPEEYLAEVAGFVEAADGLGVQICWELHPSLPLVFSDPANVTTAVDKLAAVGALGVDCFVLAFDDLPKYLLPADEQVYASYTEGQIAFVEAVGDALEEQFPSATLAYVPVEYWTNHDDTPTDLATVGATLDPRWAIAWTGVEIVPATVTDDDVEAITAIIGRPPLFGDNYPVSDAADESGTIHLGPLVGRSTTMVGALSGVAFNAMPLPFASLPGLATAADYSWHPEAYAPEASMAAVAALYGGATGAASLETLAMTNQSPQLAGSSAPALQEALDALWMAWSSADVAALEGALATLEADHFARYAAVLEGTASIAPALLDELTPWMDKLAAYGAAGLVAVSLLDAAGHGEPISPDDVATLESLVSAIPDGGPKPTGALMATFLDESLAILQSYE